MKDTILFLFGIIGSLLLIGMGGVGIWYSAQHIPAPAPRTCIKYTDNYYWKSWAGSSYDTGTEDLDTATKMAGGNPLTRFGPVCAEYQ